MYKLIVCLMVISCSVEYASARTMDVIPYNYSEQLETQDKFKVTGSGATDVDGNSSGELGVQFSGGNFHGMVIFNVADKVTVTPDEGNFGDVIRDPRMAARSFGLDLNYVFREIGKWRAAAYLGGGIANADFSDNANTIDGAIMYYSLGLLIKRPIKPNNSSAEIEGGFQVGFTNRALANNISNNMTFVTNTYGLDQDTLSGGEFVIFLKVNDVRWYAKVTNFDTDATIPNLTGVQSRIGMEVTGDFLDF